MLVTEDPAVQPVDVALGRDTLYQVIGVVARGPDPERVLPAIVELLVEATACHACFIYLREGEVLRMRAASPVYAHAVGRVELGLDEGLCGWVARHRTPAFIREGAQDDPRVKHVPELDEERFQSMVAVPLLGRDDGDGEAAIGVVVLHTQAPREFGQEVLDFLVHVASLVAGAIDNARLFEQTRRQVAALSSLADLSQEIASVTRRADLYRVACGGVRRLLGADGCRLHLVDADGGRLEPAYASPREPLSGGRPARLIDALRSGPGERALVTALTAGADDVGMLVAERARPFDEDEERLLEAVGNQLALALQKADLIERLTEEHLVRELFDALAEGRPQAAESRARAAGHDLDRPHVVAVLEPMGEPGNEWSEAAARAEARLRRVVPGSLCDPGDERLRALLPLGGGDTAGELARIDGELERLAQEERLAGGRSEPRRGLAGDERGLSEALCAAHVARAVEPHGGTRGYGELGVYRYLAQLPSGHAPDERHATAIATLAAYDGKRRTELLQTLERHLGDRGALAATARALYIHTNTLRQRLDRIEALTGLDLAQEDLLSLELALKLARLHGTS
jgi:GAF domain-containing protein